jgi:hypothetical protein
MFFRQNAFGTCGNKIDVSFSVNGCQGDFDFLQFTPTHGYPWVGREKLLRIHIADDGQFVRRPEMFFHFKRHGDAAQSGTYYYNVSHYHFLREFEPDKLLLNISFAHVF